VFTRIRWLKPEEKKKRKSADRMIVEQNQDLKKQAGAEESSVKLFLQSECCYSNFDEDYLIVSDVVKKYDEFCFENNIPSIQRQNILTSNELSDMGVLLRSDFPLPYLRGLTKGYVYLNEK